MDQPIAVIGAGLAGLSAANELLDAGRRVIVFERSAQPGGRAASTDHDGYRFNRGPHALYRNGVAHSTLRQWGVAVSGHRPSQAGALALLGDDLELLPAGPGSLVRTGLLGPREKLTLARLLARIGRLDDGAAGLTIDQWLADNTRPGPLRHLLAGLFRLTGYANAPALVDAGAALRQLAGGVEDGVLYLDGGWQSTIDGLRDRALANGATLERAQVTNVDDLLDGCAGVVIAAGGPSTVTALTGTPIDETVTGPSVEAAVLELGVRRVPERTFILGLDRPLYASVHAPPADLAPPGHAVIGLARYLEPGEQHDAVGTRTELEALARRLGVDDGDIAVDRYLHRMTVAHGLPLAERGGEVGRPDVDVVGDPRVMVAGDWIGPDGLLADAAVASGRRAARLLATARPALPLRA